MMTCMKKWTGTHYLALAGNSLYECFQEDKKEVCEFLRSEDCNGKFVSDSSGNFFPLTCCEKHTKHDKREPGLFEEEFL